MLIRTDVVTNPNTLRCPYCGSSRILDVHWDWNGEEPVCRPGRQDGSVAPRHIVWECLDCSGFFTTKE